MRQSRAGGAALQNEYELIAARFIAAWVAGAWDENASLAPCRKVLNHPNQRPSNPRRERGGVWPLTS